MFMKRALIATVCFAVCFGFIWFIKARLDTKGDPKGNPDNYSIPKKIQFSFTLQNTSAHLIKNAEFWTYAPVKQTATQRCARVKSSHPYQLITDDMGNQILHFTFNDLPPYATKIISIKADLLLSNDANSLSEDHMPVYLRPEKYIELDDADIFRLAQKLKASGGLKTAQNIFQWVAQNVQYAGYLSNDRGARYALTHKKGDCTEFMYLFVALCRANKIASRGIGGYISKESGILKPAGYHNWAEFYHNGTWKIADPQNKVFTANYDDYIAMRIISGSSDNSMPQFNRFGFKGEGLKVKMN
jgi:hypothetical protein